MNEPIYDVIDEYIREFELTEADMDRPAVDLSYIHVSRRDLARLAFHIRRQDVYVDAFLAGDAA